jgi:hypothetical protein
MMAYRCTIYLGSEERKSVSTTHSYNLDKELHNETTKNIAHTHLPSSRMAHIGDLVHPRKELPAREHGEHVVQDGEAGYGATGLPAARGIRFRADPPVTPGLGRVPEGIAGVDRVIVLVVEIRGDHQDLVERPVVLLLHQRLEGAKVILRVAHRPVLDEQGHGLIAAGLQQLAGMVREGDAAVQFQPVHAQAVGIVRDLRVVRIEQDVFKFVGHHLQVAPTAASTGCSQIFAGRLPVDAAAHFHLLGSLGGVGLDGGVQGPACSVRGNNVTIHDYAHQSKQQRGRKCQQGSKDNVEPTPLPAPLALLLVSEIDQRPEGLVELVGEASSPRRSPVIAGCGK